MTDLREWLLETAEDLDWAVNEEISGSEIIWTFSKMSDAGEDFSFDAYGSSLPDLVDDVQRYYEAFDPEEHAAFWYGKRGAPGLRALLDDADSIEDMLRDLANEFGRTVENWYLEQEDENE